MGLGLGYEGTGAVGDTVEMKSPKSPKSSSSCSADITSASEAMAVTVAVFWPSVTIVEEFARVSDGDELKSVKPSSSSLKKACVFVFVWA